MNDSLKRMQLFEFEDQPWFPDWLRGCLTRLINVMHKLLKSENQITELIRPLLHPNPVIIDLCSGSGGPMPDVYTRLKQDVAELRLILTDLFPNPEVAIGLPEGISYIDKPVDASESSIPNGLRTLICSFHHFPPAKAKEILKSASDAKQPIFIYEISDNSFPAWLWWIAIPVNIVTCLLITPLVRPLAWYQLVFTYLIPIIPVLFAWDGAVSNARTYTLEDLKILLNDMESEQYSWEYAAIPGKSKKLYAVGRPGNITHLKSSD